MFLYIIYIFGLLYDTNLILGFLYWPITHQNQTVFWSPIQAHTFSVLGSLYHTNLIILDHSSIPIYTNSWSPIQTQFYYPSFLFLGLLEHTNVLLLYLFSWADILTQFYYLAPFNLGLLYRTVFLGDFWKTCPARCSLALCHGYFRPLPPPLWGSFAARFFFFILLIFLFIFLLSSYTGKSTWSPWWNGCKMGF